MISRLPRALRVGRNGALFASALIALCAETAHAGHAPLVPEPRTILLQNGAPEHVVIGTRRGGYFVTRDGGLSWGWICEAGVGYDDEEVYPGALLENGSLVVSTGFGGLAISTDGCAWSPWLPSEQPFIADVRAAASGGRVLALEARAEGDAFVNQLWQSTDHGASWQALGESFATEAQALSFAFTESGIYVGTSGAAGAELWRADADARRWTQASLSIEPAARPRVVGAHGPDATAKVYVVLNRAQIEGAPAIGDSLLVSSDGGVSFQASLQAMGELAASALSADGEHLAVGGHADGLYVLENASGHPASAPLEHVTSMSVHALAWGEDATLYAAGHEAIDGFSVGISSDGGRTFSSLFALCQVGGPLACPADSQVGAQCSSSGETGWDVRKEVADPNACVDDEAPSAVSQPPAPVKNVGPDSSARGPADSSGCSVAAPALDSRSTPLLLAAFLASLWRGRRRRCSR